MNGTCLQCSLHGKGCSNTWQNCCKNLFCDTKGSCSTCKKRGKWCEVDLQCCEDLACNESGQCDVCTAENEPCKYQTCCEGFMCNFSNKGGRCDTCMTIGHFCPNDDLTLKCCSDSPCYKGTCLQCAPHSKSCSSSVQNCCKGSYCDSGGHCKTCQQIGDSCSSVRCCEGLRCICNNSATKTERCYNFPFCSNNSDCPEAYHCWDYECYNCSKLLENCIYNSSCCEGLSCITNTTSSGAHFNYCYNTTSISCSDTSECPDGYTICWKGYCSTCKVYNEDCKNSTCCEGLSCITNTTSSGAHFNFCYNMTSVSCSDSSECPDTYRCWRGYCSTCHIPPQPCANTSDCCDGNNSNGEPITYQCFNGTCQPCIIFRADCTGVHQCCAGNYCQPLSVGCICWMNF